MNNRGGHSGNIRENCYKETSDEVNTTILKLSSIQLKLLYAVPLPAATAIRVGCYMARDMSPAHTSFSESRRLLFCGCWSAVCASMSSSDSSSSKRSSSSGQVEKQWYSIHCFCALVAVTLATSNP